MAFENLNIIGLARTRLGLSILDTALGSFLNILQIVAVKRGKPEPGRRNREQDVLLLQLSKGWVLLITSIQEWIWLPQLNKIKLLSIPRLGLEDKEEHL